MGFGQGVELTFQEKKRLEALRFDISDAFKEKGLNILNIWGDFNNRANGLFTALVDIEKALQVDPKGVQVQPGTPYPRISSPQNVFFKFAKSKEGMATREKELEGLFGGRGKKKSRKTRKTKRKTRKSRRAH
jgi:hypothetical protein